LAAAHASENSLLIKQPSVLALADLLRLLKTIPYKEADLSLPWQNFDIAHELTSKGTQKFVADYRSTLRRSA
jgi:hypothetical protein